MARPQSITDEEILAAARAVFLDKGITATVDEVAERCGVGEATVFRRFPTKQALFLAAMDTAGEPEWARTLTERWPVSRRNGEADVRAMLLELANEMVATGRKMMPLILMKMSNPAMLDRQRPPGRVLAVLRVLTEFFDVEIKAGRIHATDPRVAARIWLGAVQHVMMFERFTQPLDSLSADAYVEGLVDLFCRRDHPPAATTGARGGARQNGDAPVARGSKAKRK